MIYLASFVVVVSRPAHKNNVSGTKARLTLTA